MWVMGEWSVVQWIVGVISFQNMYGLCGLKHHIVEMSPMRSGRTDKQTTRKDRATQLLICKKLNLTMFVSTASLVFSFNNRGLQKY